MSSRLTPINLLDFTGGLNVWSNQFNLQANESNEMCNMEVDPRAGFYTRRGWTRYLNGPQIDADDAATTWAPRTAYRHTHLDDTFSFYVANEDKLWHAHTTDNASFDELYITTLGDLAPLATPHLCDFASWGDLVYIANGRLAGTVKHTSYSSNQVVELTAPTGTDPGEGVTGPSGWNNDYTNPAGGYAPKAECVEAHAGYLFYANLVEDVGAGDVTFATRLRWCHPGGQQEDFAYGDYLDIDAGGGQITALKSFQDHLLIFKRDSIWALYGYDNASWQVIQVSQAIGSPTPTSVTRSETAVYFFSSSGRNGIYGYTDGQPTIISNRLRPIMEEIVYTDNTWLAWAQDRLWCNLAWIEIDESGTGQSTTSDTTTFAFEVDHVETGAWTRHNMMNGSLGPMIESASSDRPMAVMFSTSTDQRAIMEMDAHEGAYDILEVDGANEPFCGRYTTGWIHGDWPDRLKSWRRPTFVVRQPSTAVSILVESYRNYQIGIARNHLLVVEAGGDTFWRDLGFDDPDPGGFDWADITWSGSEETPPRGARWDADSADGSVLVRTVADLPQGGGFGKAKALKLRFKSMSGAAWGIDAVILKVLYRPFST